MSARGSRAAAPSPSRASPPARLRAARAPPNSSRARPHSARRRRARYPRAAGAWLSPSSSSSSSSRVSCVSSFVVPSATPHHTTHIRSLSSLIWLHLIIFKGIACPLYTVYKSQVYTLALLLQDDGDDGARRRGPRGAARAAGDTWPALGSRAAAARRVGMSALP